MGKFIFDTAKLFGDNVKDKGTCFDLIKNRIFGPIKLSDDNVLEDSKKWLEFLNNMDDSTLESYADSIVRDSFKDAFAGCQKGSCVAANFCKMYAEKHRDPIFEFNFQNEMINIIRENCNYESWRLIEFIMDPESDPCEHKYVPLGQNAECGE